MEMFITLLLMGIAGIFGYLINEQIRYNKERKKLRDAEWRKSDERHVEDYNRTHERKIKLPQQPGGYFEWVEKE